MITSYISEHTAEYVLVPLMKSLLEKKFSIVLPMFPWLTREFSNAAKRTYGDSSFRVLALFPRRPKIFNDDIYLTINKELLVFNKLAVEHGILAIAGCPVAKDLMELALCKECVWLCVEDYCYECLKRIDALGTMRVTDEDILEAVLLSPEQSMDSLEMFIRRTRGTLPMSFFGAKYKPVYFLVSE